MAKINVRFIVSWLFSAFLAISFVGGGFPKIRPSESTVRRFANWGYGEDFAILIGVLEMLGGVLVLIPGVATFGAGILAVVMLGAIYTHVSSGIGSPMMASIYLILAGLFNEKLGVEFCR